jgi:predicted nucleic acid-binding protein
MPEKRNLVINTGPLIALTAALGDLSLLQHLYQKVLVPKEVANEIMASNSTRFAAAEFHENLFLTIWPHPLRLSPFLQNALDAGEASVIQLALDQAVTTVCIDESMGRRIARLNGLKLTGSLGILIHAKKSGHPICLAEAIKKMRRRGIWVSDNLIAHALKLAGE